MVLNLKDKIAIKYVVGSQDKVVDARSSGAFWGNKNIVEVHRDHISVVKPDTASNLSFITLKGFVLNDSKKTSKDVDFSKIENKSKILFFTSLAGQHLDLVGELNIVNDIISKSSKEIALIPKIEATSSDLFLMLHKYSPSVLHFSGSVVDNQLLMASPHNEYEPITEEDLIKILVIFRENTKLVILNACNSYECAKGISGVIGCAIGINGIISDSSAIIFSKAFYETASLGASIQESFDKGLSASFENESDYHRSIKLGEKVENPNNFRLISRVDIDPSNLFLCK